MNNNQKQDEMLNLCKGAQNKKDVQGWNTLRQYYNTSPNRQFDATVYQKGKTIVIAFAGTQLNPIHPNDVNNDRAIAQTKIPAQYGDAQRLYEQVKKDHKGMDIQFTGYSLGGTLANLLSHYSGKPSTAFAPIGSKHIAQANPDHFKYDDSNIKTYGLKGDWLFESNLDKQSGEVHMADSLPNKNDPLNSHLIENYTSETFKNAQKVGTATGYALPADKNGVEPVIAGRIYTAEEIGKMSPDEFRKHESAINEQMSKMGVPREHEAQQAVQSGGMVYVQPYTRADGTKVKGYYRSRG
jgi:hypothetical protein